MADTVDREKEDFFRRVIAARPLDPDPWQAYADWLLERGRDEEARAAAAWTAKKLASRAWVERFVAGLQDPEDAYYTPPEDYDELMEAADDYVKSGEEFSCWQTEPDVSTERMREFWRHYRVLRDLGEGEVDDAALAAALSGADEAADADELAEMRARLEEQEEDGSGFFHCAC